MKCKIIEKGDKVIVISPEAEGCIGKSADELLQNCDKYIEKSGFRMVSQETKVPEELEEVLAYYEAQGRTFYKYVEMDMLLQEYQVPKMVVPDGVSVGFFDGAIEELHEAVAQVEDDWVQYFTEGGKYFCGFVNGEIASFCIIDYDEDCIIADENTRVGSAGCVGTLPKYRKQGIGLYMVALATQVLKEAGCDKGFIHYTALESWYAKLGYKSFMRFYM